MIAIYARQSIDKKDSISIETQVDCCRGEILGEEAQVYCDRGYSGSTTSRPAFTRLLEDVRRGAVHKVITYKLDRISRSLLDFANIVELFRRCGVAFQSTQEKFDTDTPMGNAMLSITMVFAQLERETLQQRLRDNYYARGQKGMYLGGKPPFGFARTPALVEGKATTMLEPLPLEAALVQRAFLLYGAGGRTLGETARELNAGSTDERFDATFLGRLLRNPVYARADIDLYDYYRATGYTLTNPPEEFCGGNGCYLYGVRRRSVVGGPTLSVALHQGLVESDLFLAAQRRLESCPSPPRRGTGEGSWLSGLIYCARCRRPLSFKSSRCKTTLYRYLVCPCQSHTAAGVEQAVEGAVLEAMTALGQEGYAPPRESAELEQFKLCRIQTRSRMEHLVETAAQSGPAAQPYLARALEEQAGELRRIETRWQTLFDNSAVRPMAQLVEIWPGLTTGGKRAAAALLLERIEAEGEELHLHWRHSTAF